MDELVKIQERLKVPKNQFNSFANYKYRNCEDILEALKPLLLEFESTLYLSDTVVLVGDRFYVKATATLTTKGGKVYYAEGNAREPLSKKGMDEAQITGSASSYARKYALNGLFLIDDTKDPDTNEYTRQHVVTKTIDEKVSDIIKVLSKTQTETDLNRTWTGIKDLTIKNHKDTLEFCKEHKEKICKKSTLNKTQENGQTSERVN